MPRKSSTRRRCLISLRTTRFNRVRRWRTTSRVSTFSLLRKINSWKIRVEEEGEGGGGTDSMEMHFEHFHVRARWTMKRNRGVIYFKRWFAEIRNFWEKHGMYFDHIVSKAWNCTPQAQTRTFAFELIKNVLVKRIDWLWNATLLSKYVSGSRSIDAGYVSFRDNILFSPPLSQISLFSELRNSRNLFLFLSSF